MERAFYEELQRDFIDVRHFHADDCYDEERCTNTLEHIALARDAFAKDESTRNKHFLLCCIDTLFEIIAEGNREKIFDFADTIHNVPEVYLNLRNEISFQREIEFFCRKYDESYFKDVLENLSLRKIDIGKIKSINKEVICYENQSGENVLLDLAKCAENYSVVCGAAQGKCKSVGRRLFAHPCAFYEIYADETIYFVLPLKTNGVKRMISKVFGWNFDSKAFELFYAVQKQLNAAGYTTLDLN